MSHRPTSNEKTISRACTVARVAAQRVALFALLASTQVAQAGQPAHLTSPYPLQAAGWGPTVTGGRFISRWANTEVTEEREKALTFSSEGRARFDTYNNGQLASGNDYDQGLFRSSLGANLWVNPKLRTYGEIGLGGVEGRRESATANFQNSASLQQLFVDVRSDIGPDLVGVMAGRQEFADGPRQLVSVSDGPNLHRTWNGVRVYAHGRRLRLGAFDFRGTRLGRGSFDESINYAERLQGLNGSVVISPLAETPSIFLDPFWFHTENPVFRSGNRTGLDTRNTYGARLWGKRGKLSFDWTLAKQRGHYLDRDVKAWGLFTVQSVALSANGWKPRLGTRLDLASGGGAYGAGTLKSFNQLYASSGYLGDGLFLSTSNLALLTPGISASPTSSTNLSVEYGFARRLSANDAVYGGLMRAYSGTQNVPGHTVGRLLRIGGNWTASARLTLFANFEYLAAGDVLQRAKVSSGSYTQLGVTFRQ